MKKLTSLFLAAGLIIASAGVALAQSQTAQTVGLDNWKEPASDAQYFDGTNKQYPVLGSSGVYVAYDAAQKDGKYLFYLMITESVRGDKCYGTGQDSTIIAMHDMKKTGNIGCQGHTKPTGPDEQNLWPGWRQIDSSPLPTNMTVAGASTPTT